MAPRTVKGGETRAFPALPRQLVATPGLLPAALGFVPLSESPRARGPIATRAPPCDSPDCDSLRRFLVALRARALSPWLPRALAVSWKRVAVSARQYCREWPAAAPLFEIQSAERFLEGQALIVAAGAWLARPRAICAQWAACSETIFAWNELASTPALSKDRLRFSAVHRLSYARRTARRPSERAHVKRRERPLYSSTSDHRDAQGISAAVSPASLATCAIAGLAQGGFRIAIHYRRAANVMGGRDSLSFVVKCRPPCQVTVAFSKQPYHRTTVVI